MRAMQTASRTTAWVAIVASLILALPAAADEPVPRDRYSVASDGMHMVVTVHLVSAPSSLFIVVGIAPSAAGENAAKIALYAVESFVPAAAFAPGG